MTYQEVLDYLFNQFPQYQKIGGKAFKPGLENIQKICDYLENPEKELKFVHVAGTNGKGSVSSMLASVLQEAGYKVGLFTSPHLVDFTERVRINGEPIQKEAVVRFVETHQSFFDQAGASFFEWTLALAIDHFSKEEADIVVLETGLGGRLDATNVVKPILSVITSISIDHVQFLGPNLHSIAKEKAGIIKAEVPVVTTISNPIDALEVINKKADEEAAPIYLAAADDHLTSDLLGEYQRVNKGVVLKSLEVLADLGFETTDDQISRGLVSVVGNTGLRGRWEILQYSPKVICDIGHNHEGVKEVFNQLKKQEYTKLHVIWGMVEDKEVDKVVDLLPEDATYYLSQPNIPRAMKKGVLADHFSDNFEVKVFDTVSDAYQEALRSSESDDLIFVGGSTFVVAEIISTFFQ